MQLLQSLPGRESSSQRSQLQSLHRCPRYITVPIRDGSIASWPADIFVVSIAITRDPLIDTAMPRISRRPIYATKRHRVSLIGSVSDLLHHRSSIFFTLPINCEAGHDGDTQDYENRMNPRRCSPHGSSLNRHIHSAYCSYFEHSCSEHEHEVMLQSYDAALVPAMVHNSIWEHAYD